MYIQHISIRHFGGLCHLDTDLSPSVNLIGCRETEEVTAALQLLLCSKPAPAIPALWIRPSTHICATIHVADTCYTVTATAVADRLQLTAADPAGADATKAYLCALAHCPEQDLADIFDGRDHTAPMRLSRYGDREQWGDLSGRTCRLCETGTFRSHLHRYIRTFRPESINNQKHYLTAMDNDGRFRVQAPCLRGKLRLSQTEETLFRYICFLNIAEFWSALEQTRDLHHEKKPLLIRNLLEFLDESANLTGLLTRTQALERQSIFITTPRSEQLWIGESNGIFFESCHHIYAL